MWRPIDFILRGQFCPLEQIRETADRLRADLGCSELLLFACDRRTIVRSLTVALGEPVERVRVVELAMQQAGFDVHDEINRLATSLAFGEATPRTLAQMSDEIRRLTDSAGSSLGSWTDRLVQFSLPELSDTQIQLRPLVLGTPELSTRPSSITPHQAEELLAMINATTQADSRRDRAVMESVDQHILPGIAESGLLDIDLTAKQAARLALEVTGADTAAIYLRDAGDPDQATLAAFAPIDPAAASPYPERLRSAAAGSNGEHGESLLARVLATSRALQLSSPPTTDRSMRPTTLGHLGFNSELGTPIPGPLASPTTPAVGALSIARQSYDDFSAYDLALARNICLRVALHHAILSSGEIALAIRELRRPVPLDKADTEIREPQLDAPQVPPDLRHALTRLPAALEKLAQTTNSHSASVRLALADIDAPEAHGLSLVRIAAYPPARMHEGQLYQQETRDRGLNWRTVRTGNTTYAPDISQEEEYVEYHPGTRSQLCVPIRTEGRLIGTLNLESRTLSNYGAFLPQVEALAAAVARTLVDATAHDSDLALERSADLLDRIHELDSHLRELSTKLQHVDLPFATKSELLEDAASALELIDAEVRGRRDMYRDLIPSPTIAEVITEAFRKKRLLRLTPPEMDDIGGLQQPVVAEHAALVFAATKNVLSNLREHSGKSLWSKRAGETLGRRCSVGTAIWDNHMYAAFVFENTPDRYMPRELAQRIYRVPIRGDDGTLRLGAYIAALRLRRFGAFIHFSASRHGRAARTVMLLPLPQE